MSRLSSSIPAPGDAPPEDPFRYGWRFVKRVLPDGRTELDQVPLTLEDVLHPEEEDVIPMRTLHAIQCTYLFEVVRSQPQGEPIVETTLDLRIDWGVPGIRAHSPDIAIFWGLREKIDVHKGTFHLAGSGGRCVLALEVVSPDTRNNDVVHKFDHYYRIGIPLYVIVDQEVEAGAQTLRGYRWTPQGYELIPLDGQGRLFLQPIKLFLLLRNEQLIAQDAETGKELGSYAEIRWQLEEADRKLEENESLMEEMIDKSREDKQARQDAERKVLEKEQARQGAERKVLEKEQARQDAERKARTEELARQDAERKVLATEQARQDADRKVAEKELARQDAERKVLEKEQARQDAERLAEKETAARAAAQEEVRQLRDLLSRLQGHQGPGSG